MTPTENIFENYNFKFKRLGDVIEHQFRLLPYIITPPKRSMYKFILMFNIAKVLSKVLFFLAFRDICPGLVVGN